MGFEDYARLLLQIQQNSNDPEAALKKKLRLVQEIRENFDQALASHFPEFLKFLFPVFYNDLRQGQPQFGDTVQQKIRSYQLELLNRLPSDQQLRPFVPNLLKLAMYLLEVENEDNAIICLKIIIDLHRNFRPTLENEVQPFLDIVQKIYAELPNTIRYIFSSPVPPPGTKVYLRSLQSCKVLTECPIIVVLLFQLYHRFLSHNIAKFMPLIVRTLGLQAPEGAAEKYPQQYQDYIAAQVKTLSFLAYMLRGWAEHLRPYQGNVPKYVIQLLQNCPPEAASTRKELLIATRHILATDFRTGFVPYIHLLLSQNLLTGNGRTCYEMLRPLAFSTLADLVHHVRNELPAEQLAPVVQTYARNMHDETLPFAIQTMSAKLLLNLVGGITQKRLPSSSAIIMRILQAFVSKFVVLNHKIPQLYERAVKLQQEKEEAAEQSDGDGDGNSASGNDSGSSTTTTHNVEGGAQSDSVLRVRSGEKSWTARKRALHLEFEQSTHLLKTLVVGLKPIIWGIASLRSKAKKEEEAKAAAAAAPKGEAAAGAPPPAAAASDLSAATATIEEKLLFSKLLHEGLQCCNIYQDPAYVNVAEEKEVLDQFAMVFTMLDANLFCDVVQCHIEALFDRIVQRPSVISVAQQFLTRAAPTAHVFGEILLDFMLPRLQDLSGDNEQVSELLVKLFKLVFGSITLFADNESLLVPRLGKIITMSTKLAEKAADPTNYLMLLRGLFRSIGGGKFELLYKEFLPLLPVLMKNLNRQMASNPSPKRRQLFAELCLTLPVRISALLPHMRLLMKSLTLALESDGELVQNGIRTLELCIDNLATDFLEPILSEVKDELLSALWNHIRPANVKNKNAPRSPHGAEAARVLGKLAGWGTLFRNVRINVPRKNAPSLPDLDPAMTLQVAFLDDAGKDELPYDLPLDACIVASEQILYDLQVREGAEASDYDAVDQQLGRSALHVVLSVLKSVVAPCSELDPRRAATPEEPETIGPVPGFVTGKSGYIKNKEDALKEDELLEHLLRALFLAASVPFLREELHDMLEGFVRHFAMLFVSQMSEPPSTSLTTLDHIRFLDALSDVFALENRARAAPGADILRSFWQSLEALCGSTETASELDACQGLLERFCHLCHRVEWHSKLGGCEGLALLVDILPNSWLQKYQLKIVQALLFVVQMLPEVSQPLLDTASTFLDRIIVLSCGGSVEEDANAGEANEGAGLQARSSKSKAKGRAKSGGGRGRGHAGGGAALDRDMVDRVTQLLARKLTYQNPCVRNTCQQLIRKQFEVLGETASEKLDFNVIISPDMLRSPFSKLHSTQQMGFLSALSFCLSLEPPLVEVEGNLDVLRVTEQVLSVVEVDENSRDQRPVAKLASECINLLSAVLSAVGAQQNDPWPALRQRIVRVLCVGMTNTSEYVVRASEEAFEHIMKSQELSQELVSKAITPVLARVSDAHRLTVPLLQGVHKLLRIFGGTIFGPRFADELIEHLEAWSDRSGKLLGNRLLGMGELEAVASHIISLFSLLDNGIQKLNRIVPIIHRLESDSHRILDTDYREPLLQLLNKQAEATVRYFGSYVTEGATAALWRMLFGHAEAEPLRLWVMEHPRDGLISPVFTIAAAQGESDAAVLIKLHGVLMVEQILERHPQWLASHPEVFEHVALVWRHPMLARVLETVELVPLFYDRLIAVLIRCYIHFLRHNTQEVDALFDLVIICGVRTTIDLAVVHDFFSNEVCREASRERREKILSRFVQLLRNSDPERMVTTLRYLVMPCLRDAFKTEDGLPDSFLHNLLQDLSQYMQPSDRPKNDNLAIELLNLTVIIVRHRPAVLMDFRKQLLSFAWRYLKNEDIVTRQCAYVVVCRFMEQTEAYQTPDKITFQVWVSLLRAHQQEAKGLVRKALDILLPTLRKYNPTIDEQGKIASWAKWVVKIVRDEAQVVGQLLHVLRLIVRHPEAFYPVRQLFVSPMITSLSKIGVVQSAAAENRKLSVDIVATILLWQKMYLEQQAAKKQANLSSSSNKASDGTQPMDIEQPQQQQQQQQHKKEEEEESLITVIPVGTTSDAQQKAAMAPTSSGDKGGDQNRSNSSTANLLERYNRPLDPNFQEMVFNFLLRVASSPQPDARGSTSSSSGRPSSSTTSSMTSSRRMAAMEMSSHLQPSRALALIGEALQLFPELPIQFKYFQRLIEGAKDTPHYGVAALKCLNTIVDHNMDHFVSFHRLPLQELLKIVISSSKPVLLAPLTRLLRKIGTKMPPSTNSDMREFYNGLGEATKSALLVYTGSDTCFVPLVSTLKDLLSPGWLDDFMTGVCAYAARIVQRYVSAAQSQAVASEDGTSDGASAAGTAGTSSVAEDGTAAAAVPSSSSTSSSSNSGQLLSQSATAKGSPTAAAKVDSTKKEAGDTLNVSLEDAVLSLLELISSRSSKLEDGVKRDFLNIMRRLLDNTPNCNMMTKLVLLSAKWILPQQQQQQSEGDSMELEQQQEDQGEGQENAPSAAARDNQLSLHDKIQLLLLLYKGLFSLGETGPTLQFFDMLHTFCNSEEVQSAQEQAGGVKPLVLSGLMYNDSKVRSMFFDVWLKAMGEYANSTLERLKYVLNQEDWQALGGVYWMSVVVRLLLAHFDMRDKAIALAPLSSQLARPTFRSKGGKAGSSKSARTQTSELAGVIEAHAPFLERVESNSLTSLVDAVTDVAFGCSELSHILFVHLYGQIWDRMAEAERFQLTLASNKFLGHKFWVSQQLLCPNVVQTLLVSYQRSSLPPQLDIAMLARAAKHFNCWLPCSALLQQYLNDDPALEHAKKDREAPRGASNSAVAAKEEAMKAMLGIFRDLEMGDLVVGAWRAQYPHELSVVSRRGLTLVQHGFWQRAQEVFFTAMASGMEEEESDDTAGAAGELSSAATATAATAMESAMWEEQWIECGKRLSQWNLLLDYGKQRIDPHLLMESSWRVDEWGTMQEAVRKCASLVDDPVNRLNEALVSITTSDARRNDGIKTKLSLAFHSALVRWNLLPQHNVTPAHLKLIRMFHRLVDVQESSHVVKEITNNKSRVHAINEIKAKLACWRQRVPNVWDDPLDWSNILLWRHHLYAVLTKFLHSSLEVDPATANLGYRELAWSVWMYGRVARKQHLVDSSLETLAQIYALPNIELDDAFLKLTEQVKCYLQLPEHTNDGLQIINLTNTDFFPPKQQAEFARLKALLFERQAEAAPNPQHFQDQANYAFANATNIAKAHQERCPKAWMSWGLFCDRRMELAKDQEEKSKWGEYLFSCFIQAITHDSGRAKRYLDRVLWLVCCEDFDGKRLDSWNQFAKTLPQWIWLDHLPQLFMCILQHPEMQSFRDIFQKVLSVFPQGVLYETRAFLKYAEDRVAASAGERKPSKGSGLQQLESTAEFLRESIARCSNLPEVTSLIALCEALDDAFGGSEEQRLHAALSALLRDMEMQYLSARGEGSVPSELKKRLQSIASSVFDDNATPDFVSGYQESYENEVVKRASMKSAKLGSTLLGVRDFCDLLSSELERIASSRLEELSRFLIDFRNSAVEVPGQYLQGDDGAIESNSHCRIFRLLSVLESYKAGAHVQRYLRIKATDGQIYRYYIEWTPGEAVDGVSSWSLRNNRALLLRKQLNRVLNRSVFAQRRPAQFFHIPWSVMISPALRLSSTNDCFVTPKDALTTHLNAAGKERDCVLKELKAYAGGQGSAEELWEHITTNLVPHDVLQQRVMRALDNPAALFSFRSCFFAQLALYSSLSYLLRVPVAMCTPGRLAIALDSGLIRQNGLFPDHSDLLQGKKDKMETEEEAAREAVFNRLTPNVLHLGGPVLREGVLCSAMCNFLAAIRTKLPKLRSHFKMYWWNDLAYNALDEAKLMDSAGAAKMKAFVEERVADMEDRLMEVAPDMSLAAVNKAEEALDHKVAQLIEKASSPSVLAALPVSDQYAFLPWL